MMKKNKRNRQPTRLDVQDKLHKTYKSVTEDVCLTFPSERRALGTTHAVKAKHCKKYVTSTPPRGW